MQTYALSLKQPWAALLVTGRKTIEVRRWPTRRRGRVLIHAARLPDPRPDAWKWVSEAVRPLTGLRGGIIGEGSLTECVTYTALDRFVEDRDLHLNDPAWFIPPQLYGFTFTQLKQLDFWSVPGNIRFFRVDEPERTSQ